MFVSPSWKRKLSHACLFEFEFVTLTVNKMISVLWHIPAHCADYLIAWIWVLRFSHRSVISESMTICVPQSFWSWQQTSSIEFDSYNWLIWWNLLLYFPFFLFNDILLCSGSVHSMRIRKGTKQKRNNTNNWYAINPTELGILVIFIS